MFPSHAYIMVIRVAGVLIMVEGMYISPSTPLPVGEYRQVRIIIWSTSAFVIYILL